MFSTNPFHVFPPSNSILDNEKHNLYNPFHFSKQDSVEEQGLEQSQCDEYNDNDYHNHDLYWSEIKKEKASKKDHHSKIHTAQGPRDRRVRLSIEVAKKFFYLQDLLGDDKASKTLDWLLKKSKISIDELIKRKKESSFASSSVTDRSEVVFMESTGSDEQNHKGRKNKCGVEGKRKMVTRKYKSGFSVNQSRAEARARARERTKKKLNFKNIDNESKSTIVHVDCCSSSISFWNSVETLNVAMLSNDSSSKFTALPEFADLVEQQGDCATI